MRQCTKNFVNKDLLDFKEAKKLTVQAFAEIKVNSENFFDFIENLRSKVQELIVERQQEKQNVKANKIQTR